MAEIELLQEPFLEFNDHFLHPDKKTGLAEYGPFGRTLPGRHPREIKVGIVGTRTTLALCERWLEECRNRIESDRSQKRTVLADDEYFDEDLVIEALVKRQAPDFVGLNPDGPFATELLDAEIWKQTFRDKDAQEIADLTSPVDRVEKATNLIMEYAERVATTTPPPDVIIVAMPQMLLEDSTVAELGDGSWLNLRRSIKARSMKHGVPIQIVREDTLSGKKKGLQDKATRAWNFATGLYFKANGVPWRGHGLEQDTCYIGVTFYQSEDETGRRIMRSGIAQAFDYLGQGVVLRGSPFEWDVDEQGRTPHLTTEGATVLMRDVLTEYAKVRGLPPKRVVVHKSSRFWGASHAAYNELRGFHEGIEEVNPNAVVDLVTLARSEVRLIRQGEYPPLRGTFALVGESYPVLYTHGFTPYFDTYPGVHVPQPWTVLEHHGDSDLRHLVREMLALTKMNVNNASFSDGEPITLGFSRKVGEILRHVGSDMPVRPEYRFYM